MPDQAEFDVIVVGGGPSGATAAHELARRGRRVLMIERAFRIKPCGGAIPPCLIEEFDIPAYLLKARIKAARMISPTARTVDMPIADTFVGMVDRDEFDPWLRERAVDAGAELRLGAYQTLRYDDQGLIHLTYRAKSEDKQAVTVTCKAVIAADGARSKVASHTVPCSSKLRWVFAYHEIIEAPTAVSDGYDPERCDVWYQGKLSPDFYAWVFPHGKHASIGVGSEGRDFSAPKSVTDLRQIVGLDTAKTVRREGAPIPMKPLKRWDDGRGVLLSGDAAGVVAPASGEGIYYAMLCGRLSAATMERFLLSGSTVDLKHARLQFMKLHGKTFWALGLLQRFWYSSDKRREKFVAMCQDPDVQELTWKSYTTKKLVKRRKAAHFRVVWKDILQLLGLSRVS